MSRAKCSRSTRPESNRPRAAPQPIGKLVHLVRRETLQRIVDLVRVHHRTVVASPQPGHRRCDGTAGPGRCGAGDQPTPTGHRILLPTRRTPKHVGSEVVRRFLRRFRPGPHGRPGETGDVVTPVRGTSSVGLPVNWTPRDAQSPVAFPFVTPPGVFLKEHPEVRP